MEYQPCDHTLCYQTQCSKLNELKALWYLLPHFDQLELVLLTAITDTLIELVLLTDTHINCHDKITIVCRHLHRLIKFYNRRHISINSQKFQRRLFSRRLSALSHQHHTLALLPFLPSTCKTRSAASQTCTPFSSLS